MIKAILWVLAAVIVARVGKFIAQLIWPEDWTD